MPTPEEIEELAGKVGEKLSGSKEFIKNLAKEIGPTIAKLGAPAMQQLAQVVGPMLAQSMSVELTERLLKTKLECPRSRPWKRRRKDRETVEETCLLLILAEIADGVEYQNHVLDEIQELLEDDDEEEDGEEVEIE